jgi:hypothetical protein
MVAMFSSLQDITPRNFRFFLIFIVTIVPRRGPGSSVGIATGYGLNGLGIKSRWEASFPHMSKPTLRSTQPPVQWVPGLFRGEKSDRSVTLTPHPFLVPWSWKSRAVPLLPLWAVRLVQSLSAYTRVTFTFTFYCFRTRKYALLAQVKSYNFGMPPCFYYWLRKLRKYGAALKFTGINSYKVILVSYVCSLWAVWMLNQSGRLQ